MELYTYRAHVVRVVDGDTIDVTFDLGFSIGLGSHSSPVRLRLAGIDTPEVYGVKKDSEEHAEGVAASERVRSLIEGRDVIVRTIKSSRGDKKGSFGRYLAYVYFDLDGDEVELNGLLLEEGLAQPYRQDER